MRGSIRQRVTLGTFAAITGMLILLSAIVYVGVRSSLIRQFDRTLLEEGRYVAALVGFEEGELAVDLEDLEHEAAPEADDEAYLEFRVAADGRVLHRTEDLPEGVLPRPEAPPGRPVFSWARHPEEGRLRCVTLTFRPVLDPDDEDAPDLDPEDAPRIRVTLGRSDEAVASVLSRLTWLLLAAGIPLALAAAVVSRAIARRGLRPLDDFAGRIAELDDRSLSRRLDVERTPLEVAPVGARLNELLDHLEATLERERAFSADIAHELRSPLAGLRSTAEVTLSRSRDADAYRAAVADMMDVTVNLEALVDRLLWLVRLDAGTVDIEIRAVDPATLLESAREALAADVERRRLRLHWDVPGGTEVASDPVLLGILLRNLLENAVAYADEGGSVSVAVAEASSAVTIAVANSGSRVSQADVPHLLRRFTRGDEARTPVGSRCGLGLALVGKIAERLDHRLEIRTEPGGSFEVTLSAAPLPA